MEHHSEFIDNYPGGSIHREGKKGKLDELFGKLKNANRMRVKDSKNIKVWDTVILNTKIRINRETGLAFFTIE